MQAGRMTQFQIQIINKSIDYYFAFKMIMHNRCRKLNYYIYDLLPEILFLS